MPWKFPLNLIFIPEFTEFLVEWLAFRKFNNLQISVNVDRTVYIRLRSENFGFFCRKENRSRFYIVNRKRREFCLAANRLIGVAFTPNDKPQKGND